MKTADAKASDMAAAQSGAAQMRYAAETHPAASAAETHHPAASAAQMHSAASEVETTTTAAPEVSTAATTEVSTTATAEVSTATATATAAAAAEGLRSQWRHNGRQRRQQDCANHKSVIFHEYLPELHRNVSRLSPSGRSVSTGGMRPRHVGRCVQRPVRLRFSDRVARH